MNRSPLWRRLGIGSELDETILAIDDTKIENITAAANHPRVIFPARFRRGETSPDLRVEKLRIDFLELISITRLAIEEKRQLSQLGDRLGIVARDRGFEFGIKCLEVSADSRLRESLRWQANNPYQNRYWQFAHLD